MASLCERLRAFCSSAQDDFSKMDLDSVLKDLVALENAVETKDVHGVIQSLAALWDQYDDLPAKHQSQIDEAVRATSMQTVVGRAST